MTTPSPSFLTIPLGTHLSARSSLRTFWILWLSIVLGLLLSPSTALATSISCGQTVANTTANASQVDQYSYVGTAGQVLAVSLWSSLSPNPNFFHPMVADIYSPDGQLLISVSQSEYYTVGSGGGINLALTNTGTYTILVYNSTYAYTASYELSLQSVIGGGCAAQAISCGQTVANATTNNSEMDAYSYVGTASQVLAVSLWSGLNPNPNFYHPMVADIYSPSGQLLVSASDTEYYTVGSGGGVNLTLTNSGTYTIVVHTAKSFR